jgi:hypothetical protein
MPLLDGDLDMVMASQAECPLLAKLPPELRNHIYEYVFTSERSSRQNLYTATMSRPWSNLILTCQRIFAETKGIYEVARTSYWGENTFYVNRLRENLSTWPSAQQVVNKLHDRELNLIREIIIVCRFEYARREWRLNSRSDSMHGWILTSPLSTNNNTHSLVGKRSGLYRAIHLLS